MGLPHAYPFVMIDRALLRNVLLDLYQLRSKHSFEKLYSALTAR